MDLGKSLNPAIDIGQVEGGFVQGMGWACIEELVWGDAQHPWVRPGTLHTRGPGEQLPIMCSGNHDPPETDDCPNSRHTNYRLQIAEVGDNRDCNAISDGVLFPLGLLGLADTAKYQVNASCTILLLTRRGT